jgi:RNA polymerase sigma-70 factor, ECF subfamily
MKTEATSLKLALWREMSRGKVRRDAGTLYRVADPEDLLGEVFLQVARDIKKVPSDDLAARKWVFAVARNRVIDEIRRGSRRPKVSDRNLSDLADSPAHDPMDPALLAALNNLTPDQREVVLLRFVADLPLDDVATMTRRSVGAIKALQHRALAQLAKAVSPEVRPTL